MGDFSKFGSENYQRGKKEGGKIKIFGDKLTLDILELYMKSKKKFFGAIVFLNSLKEGNLKKEFGKPC